MNKESSYLTAVDVITDVLFWIDLLINMFSGYYDEEGKLIMQRKIVIMRYLKSWFFWDLLSCIPLSYFIDSENNSDG